VDHFVRLAGSFIWFFDWFPGRGWCLLRVRHTYSHYSTNIRLQTSDSVFVEITLVPDLAQVVASPLLWSKLTKKFSLEHRVVGQFEVSWAKFQSLSAAKSRDELKDLNRADSCLRKHLFNRIGSARSRSVSGARGRRQEALWLVEYLLLKLYVVPGFGPSTRANKQWCYAGQHCLP